MIISTEASGFKSLEKFKLVLDFGLNVLAGPNGAGKSNILELFRFIGYVVSNPLPMAFSKIGGVMRVFRRLPQGKTSNKMKTRVTGITFDEETSDNKITALQYVYEFSIHLNKTTNKLYFGKQKIMLNELSKNGTDWINFFTIEGTDKAGFKVSKLIVNRLGLRSFPRGHNTRVQMKKDIEDTAKSSRWQSQCLLGRIDSMLYRAYCVKEDLSKDFSLNINPEDSQLSEDLTEEPGITSDGMGLPSTLSAIQKDNPKGYERIVKLLRLANPEIVNISVDSDPRDNSQTVWFKIKSDQRRHVKLPISDMSDGTIKWLVIMTAVTWHKDCLAGLIIEEPENYLHPWMQQEIVNILRETCEDNNLATTLLSTHSETILNSAKPDELCICHMHNGITKVSRPKNVRDLRKEIKQSGFGLGYFYLAGAVENV